MRTLRTPVAALAVVVVLLASTSGAVASTAAASGASPAAAPADSPAVSADRYNATLDTDGEELVFRPAPDQTVRGETTLEPGTNVTVVLEGPTFYAGETTTVADDGTFAASFDLGSASPGATVGVAVEADPSGEPETTLVTTTASVECSDDCTVRTTDSDGGETTTGADAPGVQSIVDVTQSRVASVDVLFGDADALTVSVGGSSVNYVVNGTIEDEDGDGRATVLFYTGRAGTDAPTLGVIDAGERRVVKTDSETPLDAPLAPGSYGVTLFEGPNATGGPAAEGRVLVFEEATEESPVESDNTSIVADGGELVLDPDVNQTIRGGTDREPGTNLSVEVEGETFLSVSVATVAEDGTFEATVDASSAAGQELDIRVYHDDALLTETDGRVACEDDCERATTESGDAGGTDASSGGEDPSNADADAPSADGSGDRLLGGVGMIALGGVLAVAGIGVLLGIFRT